MQSVINFIIAHQAALSAIVVGVLDLVFALNPNANAPDGILHALYVFIKSRMAPKAP